MRYTARRAVLRTVRGVFAAQRIAALAKTLVLPHCSVIAEKTQLGHDTEVMRAAVKARRQRVTVVVP